jgi:hypothetical protein
MKSYLAPNRLPIFGIILLIVGSVILGVAIGILAYFVSNLIYYIFAFSLVVGGATMIAYYKLLQFAKVRHSIIAAFMGLATGLLVALAYYATPYWILRNEFVTNAQQNYQVSAEKASGAFDKILVEETGAGGFVGYMKLRAKEGDQFTNYVVENGMPIHEFSFTLKSTWAWIYWLLETAFFSIPTAWIGYDVGKRAFSESANDWYNPLPKQICAVPLESKEKILALLKGNSLQEISELAIAEEKITHPMIEIYEQRSDNKKGDILLSVKQTYRDNKEKIKRNVIAQWEVSEPKYTSFFNAVSRKLAELT